METTSALPAFARSSEDYVNDLQWRKKILVGYMQSSIGVEDWHAVRDAVVDVELIEKELEVLNR